MKDAYHFYRPDEGHGLPHDPLNAIIGPRPIGWVSTLSQGGLVNLAPYSFFNAFNYRPPIIGFSSTGAKDSLANVRATGEFVWNIATRKLAEQMNATSASVPHETNEFELAGLTQAPSRLVAPPRVEESPVNFECKVTQIVQLQDRHERPVSAWLVLGESSASIFGRICSRTASSTRSAQTSSCGPAGRPPIFRSNRKIGST